MDRRDSVTVVHFLLIFLSCNGVTSEEIRSPCHFDVKVKQILHNEGFHRNLTYGIVFGSEFEDAKWIWEDCIVALIQSLPPGLYVNPDELEDMRRSQQLNVRPGSKVNVELSTEESSTSYVYILGKVIRDKAYLWLPVHARYHKAKFGGGTARNDISPPHMYLRCPDARLATCGAAEPLKAPFLCNGAKDDCRWNFIRYTLVTAEQYWYVPVGNTAHYYLVATGTAAAIVGGSLYLLKTIHDYTVAKKKVH